MLVVTWQSPSGDRVRICQACEARLKADEAWTHDRRGQEHCQVSHGLHWGYCDLCDGDLGQPTSEGRNVW
jgi:hypothetical protein